ncbi:MAG: hypothetical protein EPN23_10090 [Verrucomicrobia bacterium]|nr:MAG: hypothetical protein EPN23_10090 [Verrucomicrobiota bacterium]
MNTWFLRKPEGTIFGPVEQAELLRWASTDRIGPEDLVSADGKDWLSAPSSDLYCLPRRKSQDQF